VKLKREEHFTFHTDVLPEDWYDTVRHMKRTKSDYFLDTHVDVQILNLSPDECEFQLHLSRSFRFMAHSHVTLRYDPKTGKGVGNGYSYNDLEVLFVLIHGSLIISLTLPVFISLPCTLPLAFALGLMWWQLLNDYRSLRKIIYTELNARPTS
jgi:hypothetical protein